MDVNVPPVADERAGLLGFLAQQRRVVRAAAHGLTEDEIRLAPSASALSIGGLLKHLTGMERFWVDAVLRRPVRGSRDDHLSQFQLSPEVTLKRLLADYDEAAAETSATVGGVADLGQPVPVPDEPWSPKDVEAWSVRWVLLHMIEETARHAGHADIIRESIDGATGLELLAAAENWEPTPWLTPWRPRTPV